MTDDEQALFAEVVKDVPSFTNEILSQVVRDTRKLLIYLESEAIKRELVIYD